MHEILYEYIIVDEWSPYDGERGEIRAISELAALNKLRKRYGKEDLSANIRAAKFDKLDFQ